MDDNLPQGGDAGAGHLEGSWYADSFRVGHNAFEFKLDCGHEGPDNKVTTVYFRIIANPFSARELFQLLGAGLLRYADTFGAMDDNAGIDREPGGRP